MASADLSRLKIPEESRAPSKGSHRFSPLLSLAAGALAASVIWFFATRSETTQSAIDRSANGRSTDNGGERSATAAAGSASVVGQEGTAASSLKESSARLTATGYVVAQRKASVSSKVTGTLNELRVVEGDAVKKGDIIGILENDDLKARVRELEAAVVAAKAAVAVQAATVEETDRDLSRARRLRAAKVIPEAEFDRADAAYKRAVAEAQARGEQVRLAEAQLEGARVELDFTYIRAPFDGTVLTKNADVGEVVSPLGASAESRAAVVTIADMLSLQVEADVSEANIARISVGQKAEIVLDAYPDASYEGVVERVVPTVDKAKATVLTKVRFMTIDARVLPEMAAKVRFR